MSNVKRITVSQPLIETQCRLGEAPFWESNIEELRFVDIIKKQILRIPTTSLPEEVKTQDLDISVGTTADIEGDDEHFIFGGKHGYGTMNRVTGEYSIIKNYWDGQPDLEAKERNFRGNDGAVDGRGRYWVGVMRDPLVNEPRADGVVFRLDPDLSLHRMIEGVTIPNGISWTNDNKSMYFTDSTTKCIFKYDYDIDTGSISNRQIFYRVEDEKGVPDGHAQDEHGNLWTCIHGMGKVICLSPKAEVLTEIDIPTRCPTCPAFVAEDLYITSAEEEEPDAFPESVKLQGALFKVHVGVKGKPLDKFRSQKWAS